MCVVKASKVQKKIFGWKVFDYTGIQIRSLCHHTNTQYKKEKIYKAKKDTPGFQGFVDKKEAEAVARYWSVSVSKKPTIVLPVVFFKAYSGPITDMSPLADHRAGICGERMKIIKGEKS